MMCLGKRYFLEKAEIVPMNKTVTSVTDALISNLASFFIAKKGKHLTEGKLRQPRVFRERRAQLKTL